LNLVGDNIVARNALLKARAATPYQTRILDSTSTFAEETDGTWQLIDADGDGIPDLNLIKTANTPSGNVEVHIASASSGFQTRIFEGVTAFGEETDGTWQLVPATTGLKPDLVFIKTANAGTDTVEVHTVSGASNYETHTLDTGTTFGEETDGTWSLVNFDGDDILDLAFIKTANTPSGHVEVHIASGASGYKTRIFELATVFGEETDGVWALRPFSGTTPPDLVFIKTSNTGTGTIEVHVASGASNYQTLIQQVGSDFAEENNGVFALTDFNRDGILDLTYIKDQNTGSGTVEVHVSSGA